ncbi:MAG TPA: bifunctional UDP-2,4-diacetamido-2,4,6-trideoxy-beta-L-altropyranose hydrolase/GNAT family N-acetyltransferase, partial [Pontibacter sp.]
PYTKLLPGPAYALLRAPFLAASKQHRDLPEGESRLLLNLGGADPENYTLRLAQEIASLHKATTIDIVVGSAYRHLEELQSWLQNQPNYTLHQNLHAGQMCRLMQQCAVAVTSASGVAYEYAAVGGLLFIVQTADNQAGLYSFLTESGIAQPYTSASLSIDLAAQFNQQVAVQRQYFDGQSDTRLRAVFQQLEQSASLKLRPATIADLQLVYDWNNDPEVRKRSFNPEPILLENHTHWYKAKLEDAACRFYIATIAGTPAAQIRFDVKGETATISYLISREFRGKGLSHTVLLKGIATVKAALPQVKVIEGLVQQNNPASVRAFEKVGFAYATPDPKHPAAFRFVLELSTEV